jgi:hypothetical protein
MGSLKTIIGVLATAVFAASLSISSSSSAAIIFSDDFDTDSATTVLNFNAFNHWTVVNHPQESVDYIRSGAFGINCVGNAGGCVDLDGTTGSAGRMVSKTIFNFEPDVVYTLSVELSGNQRGGLDDAFELGIEGFGSGAIFMINPFYPFATHGFSFVSSTAFSGRLFMQDASPVSDNVGLIVDNVVLSDSRPLPEPGALVLVAMGLAALMARRKVQ